MIRRMDPLPIEVRPGCLVRIAGLPLDFTGREAARVARVILAFGGLVTLPPPEDDADEVEQAISPQEDTAP